MLITYKMKVNMTLEFDDFSLEVAIEHSKRGLIDQMMKLNGFKFEDRPLGLVIIGSNEKHGVKVVSFLITVTTKPHIHDYVSLDF